MIVSHPLYFTNTSHVEEYWLIAGILPYISNLITSRCKTRIQADQITGLMKSPSPSVFPDRGSMYRDDGESDIIFSGAIGLSAKPDALV